MSSFVRSWRGWLAAVALVVLAAGGCASDSGSKEFIPGKGWKSTRATADATPA